MLASCCVARKIRLSRASASSSARTLDSRPTTNGVIMNGKMTTSRMGIIGSFLVSNFSLVELTQYSSLFGPSYEFRSGRTPVISSLLHETSYGNHRPDYNDPLDTAPIVSMMNF